MGVEKWSFQSFVVSCLRKRYLIKSLPSCGKMSCRERHKYVTCCDFRYLVSWPMGIACFPSQKALIKTDGNFLRHDYLITYAYFDKMLFRTVCFYQRSWKLNYKCSLMALAILLIWVHFRSSNFRHVTDNWVLTVKIFTLKWGKDNERATSSFRYIVEAIKKVLINSPCMCVYVI